MSIRSATTGDIEGILACLRVAFAPYERDYSAAGLHDTVLDDELLRARLTSMSVLVAVADDGTIVGTVGGQLAGAGEGHIRGMAVLPAWAGTGVAATLLHAIEQELADKGCCRITLDTTAPLERAARFYLKHGYERSGRVTDFFGMSLFEYVKQLRGI